MHSTLRTVVRTNDFNFFIRGVDEPRGDAPIDASIFHPRKEEFAEGAGFDPVEEQYAFGTVGDEEVVREGFEAIDIMKMKSMVKRMVVIGGKMI